jgi:predicted RNA-binding protein
MCESSVYIKEGDAERLLLADVTLVRQAPDGLYLEDILGRSQHIAGHIETIDLVNHRIIVTE